ncbi:Succinate--CoA ligase [ADP-forming] subunit beta [subsurface metagenome]
MNLYRLFWTKDCSLVEINPLVTTAGGKVVALDAKVNFDDSALFRHSDIQALRDLEQEDPLEVRARDLGMNNYIKMTGNIGCMVNGAGLAMAVMDMIAQLGGSVANFLDVGVVNNIDRVVNAFRMFASDPGIKVVLINIFGGITRVDVIARGIVEAYKQMGVHFPIVIRLAGTNVEDGKRILAESGISYLEAGDLYDTAQKAVMVARGKR